MKYTLDNFYQSKSWILFRMGVLNDRLDPFGQSICEECGLPIVNQYDCIAHHITPLTDLNVNDMDISLNPGNIMLVHHRCHNRIHNKLGKVYKQVYVVYGSPLSGKSTWVKDVCSGGDMIVDMDSIWTCLSGLDKYNKPPSLTDNVFAVRDELLRQIQYRFGRWKNAYVIGGYPLISERERLVKRLGAQEVFIDTPKEECLLRLRACQDGRKFSEWEKYISDWWDKYTPPTL